MIELRAQNKWNYRAVRVWVALLAPIGIVCMYFSYESHKDIGFWQESVSSNYESIKFAKKNSDYVPLFGIENTRQQFDLAVENRNDAATRKKIYGIAALFLLTLPLTYMTVLRVIQWIWYGDSRNRP